MKRRILVVQENTDEASESADNIRRFGHAVLCVRSTREASDLLADTSFDAVCIDWPSGKELLVHLRKDLVHESMPVFIFVNPPVRDNDVLEGYHFGGDMVFTKPLEPDAWNFLLNL